MKYEIDIKVTKELEKDLQQYGRLFSIGMTEYAREELDRAAFDAFTHFYASYTPHSYKRHYYNFLERVHKPYYRNPHNTIYRGGVELDPGWMNDVYRDPREDVFETVMAGLHGPVYNLDKAIVPMSPNPLEIITKRRDEIGNEAKKEWRRGAARARQGTYQTIEPR